MPVPTLVYLVGQFVLPISGTFLQCFGRAAIRKKHQIQGDDCNDFICSCFCGCCTLIQVISAHLRVRMVEILGCEYLPKFRCRLNNHTPKPDRNNVLVSFPQEYNETHRAAVAGGNFGTPMTVVTTSNSMDQKPEV